MTGFGVAGVSGLEILDSRGRPTLAVTVRLAGGTTAGARVPSGASTGSREVAARGDGDQARSEGRGVRGAVAAVSTEIAGLLRERSWFSLGEADQAMIDLDGTANKSRLGANATVGVSMALGGGGAVPAGAALQCPQRRRARAGRAGFPGIHDRPAERLVDGRSRPGRRRGLRRANPRSRNHPGRVRYRRCLQEPRSPGTGLPLDQGRRPGPGPGRVDRVLPGTHPQGSRQERLRGAPVALGVHGARRHRLGRPATIWRPCITSSPCYGEATRPAWGHALKRDSAPLRHPRHPRRLRPRMRREGPSRPGSAACAGRSRPGRGPRRRAGQPSACEHRGRGAPAGAGAGSWCGGQLPGRRGR